MNIRSVTSMTAMVLLVASIAFTAPMHQAAFAQNDGQGMEMMVTASGGSDKIKVTGTIVKSLETDITFTVTSPNGLNIVDVDQITPVDGKFAKEFTISPDTWKADGMYTITATSGIIGSTSLYKISLPVTVVGGMAQDTMVMEGNLEKFMVYNQEPAIIEPAGITIEATAEIGSDTIMIAGTTDKMIEDIALTVTAPNGNIVTIEQITASRDGGYEATIITGGPLWNVDGMYKVTAQQGEDPLYVASTEVDIEDGLVVPEFGTIAAMILAVAVVSIIAVSARSRLSMIVGQ